MVRFRGGQQVRYRGSGSTIAGLMMLTLVGSESEPGRNFESQRTWRLRVLRVFHQRDRCTFRAWRGWVMRRMALT